MKKLPSITVNKTTFGFVAQWQTNGGTVEQLLPAWVCWDNVKAYMRDFFNAPFSRYKLIIGE